MNHEARAPAYDEHQAQCEDCGVLIARAAKRTRERGSKPPRWRCGDCHESQMRRVPATALKVEIEMRARQACSFCGERVVFFDMRRDHAWCASCGKGWRPA